MILFLLSLCEYYLEEPLVKNCVNSWRTCAVSVAPYSLSSQNHATFRVMARLNLTLDPDTYSTLERYAKQAEKPCARLAREILSEGLSQRAAQEQRKRLAEEYAAGRADARAVLKDWEGAQAELLSDDDA